MPRSSRDELLLEAVRVADGHDAVRSLGYRLGYYGHRDWPYRVT